MRRLLTNHDGTQFFQLFPKLLEIGIVHPTMNTTKRFLKDFYETDAINQDERKFVHYAHFREMYQNLSAFEKYYVQYRQENIIAAILKNGLAGKIIVDCGCAEGFISFEMSSAGANVIGLDLSAHKIRMAKNIKKKSKNNNIDFIVADAENLPIKQGTCDIVILSEIIEHLPNPSICLNGIGSILTEKGLAFITIPKIHKTMGSALKFSRKKTHKVSYDFDPHIQSFDRNKFLNLLQSCGLKTISVNGIVFPIPRKLSFLLKFPKVVNLVNYLLSRFVHVSILFSVRKFI